MVVVSTNRESPTLAVLEIEVPADEVSRAYEAVTRAYSKRAAIPGFRKGHAPESLVRQRFSEEIRGDVLEALLPDAVASAVEEQSLDVLGRPRIAELKWDPPGAIRFSARLDIKPVVEPPEWRGVPVEDTSVEPSEDEIAGVIDRLREGNAEFHPVDGRPSASGDYAVADVAGTFVEILEPGQNPRSFRDEKLTLEIGHADSMPEINEALLGVLPGQTRRFRKSFPEDFPNEEFRGKTVDYEVTLAALKEKKLPAADDEFARMVAEGETLESLRERIRGSLRAEREAERRRRLRHAILDQLLSRVEVPAPEALVEAETESALRDYARYLSANGVDPQQADWQKLRDDARPGAERRVREYLLIDAIARKENVEVSETEVEAEFKRAAARRGLDPAVLREQMAKADGLNALRDEIRLSKTLDMMIDKAALTPARPAGNG
jgi:trigger factor